MGKLPYIPDKSMYAAVMGACKWIRETGYFNKATKWYASHYGVDLEELQRYVRIAQSNGQKQKNKGKERHYRWFAVEYSMGNERALNDFFCEDLALYTVLKGLTEETVTKRLSKNDRYTEHAYQHYFGRIRHFETQGEAERCAREWEAQKKAKYKREV